MRIRAELNQLFGANDKLPFLVANKLHRVKMDPNREGSLCCADTTEPSYTAYNDFHNFITQNFNQNYLVANGITKALLIDVHGQAHPEGWVELGYLFSSNHSSNQIPFHN